MALADDGIEAGGATPPATIDNWDAVVWVSHGLLLTLFLIALTTDHERESLHIAAGTGVAILVALRVVWGLIGPQSARFSNIVRPAREMSAFLRDLMFVALLAALAGAAGTGYLMTTDTYWDALWVERLHYALADCAPMLAGLHLIGVAVASLQPVK